MSVVIGVVFVSVALLELITITIEIFGWRKEPAAVRWRRIFVHVGVWVLVVGGYLAIVHFGPLRPVHEWLR
jgi:hypothetical protein